MLGETECVHQQSDMLQAQCRWSPIQCEHCRESGNTVQMCLPCIVQDQIITCGEVIVLKAKKNEGGKVPLRV